MGAMIARLAMRLSLSGKLRQVLANAGWMMGEQILRMLVALLVSAWVARSLGPVDFGVLSYAQSFAAILVVVSTMGMNRLVVRELVEQFGDSANQARIVTTAFTMRVLAALVLYVGAVALAAFEQHMAVVALVATSILASPFDTVYQYFQAHTKARIPVVARSLAFFAATGLKVVVLRFGGGLTAIAATITAEYALCAVGLYVAYRRHAPRIAATPDRHLAQLNLRESWPEIIAGLSGILFMRLDQLMLESLQGMAAVGVFAVASRLSEAWYFIPVSLVASAFPKILPNRNRPDVYYAQISKLMVALVGMSYMAGIAATTLGRPIVEWLYGSAYAESAAILAIHIWCGLFVGLGQVSGAWLSAERKLAINLQRNLFGLLINIPLNYILIPRFGPVGAAWGTLGAMTCAWYLFDLINPLTRRMFFIKSRALILLPQRTRAASNV